MNRTGILVVAILGIARAGATQSALPLTLAEAERLALANNPQLSAAQLSAAASSQVPMELRAAFQPAVSGAVTGVEADSGSRLAAGALNNPVLYSRVGMGLALSQLVTDFGRTSSLVDSATLHAHAQDQVTQTTRAQLLLAVTRAYFGALKAEAVLKVAQETVAARQLVTDQVSTLAASNLKSTLDVSFANVNLSEARLLLAEAQSNVKSAHAELATAIGLPDQYERGGFSLAPEPLPDRLPTTLDAFMERALRDRPELASLRLEQSAARRFVDAEADLVRPTVSIAAAAGVVPTADTPVRDHYAAVGINVGVPILNGHLFRARRTEAELRARALEQTINDLTNRVARDVRIAYLNASNAFERLALTTQLLDQARLALDLAQRRYGLGLSSIIELSQAQLNVTRAEIAGSSAQFDYLLTRANLSYQIGALH